MWAIGRWLGKRYLFGAVGVRDGQVKMLARCGGQTAPAIAPIFVEEYDDELSVMYFDLRRPPPGVAAQLETVERLLGLRGVVTGAAAEETALFPMRVGVSDQNVVIRTTEHRTGSCLRPSDLHRYNLKCCRGCRKLPSPPRQPSTRRFRHCSRGREGEIIGRGSAAASTSGESDGSSALHCAPNSFFRSWIFRLWREGMRPRGWPAHQSRWRPTNHVGGSPNPPKGRG